MLCKNMTASTKVSIGFKFGYCSWLFSLLELLTPLSLAYFITDRPITDRPISLKGFNVPIRPSLVLLSQTWRSQLTVLPIKPSTETPSGRAITPTMIHLNLPYPKLPILGLHFRRLKTWTTTLVGTRNPCNHGTRGLLVRLRLLRHCWSRHVLGFVGHLEEGRSFRKSRR